MTLDIFIGIAAFLVYLFGGAIIIFIYGAYKNTGNFNLIILALGLFLLIFGSNLWVVYRFVLGVEITVDIGYLISLLFQIPGVLLIFYSAVKK
jgi:hypothetical protein